MEADRGGRMVWEFPRPRATLRLVYAELDKAVHGTPEQKAAVGDAARLPRPWLPSSLVTAGQRTDLWIWLDEVVIWLNHDYAFDPSDAVPVCWPQHPQLVHELAVLADQRRHAEAATTSDGLEDWHRYSLPAFVDRTRGRLTRYCLSGEHPRWPNQAAFDRLVSEDEVEGRRQRFVRDVRWNESSEQSSSEQASRLRLVDLGTGEITE